MDSLNAEADVSMIFCVFIHHRVLARLAVRIHVPVGSGSRVGQFIIANQKE